MKILNIGSLNIDRVYRVERFVRPGETIKARSYAESYGGKGLNQSVSLARAGADVWHVGAVGDDGQALVSLLKGAGADCRFVECVGGPTGHAVIQVDDTGQNDIIICGGSNDELSRELIDRALAEVGAGDAVLLQNETSNVGYAMRVAKERGAVVIFNPSPINESALALDLDLVDLFIVNEHEASALTGVNVNEGAFSLIEALRSRFDGARIVLTLGSAGSCYADCECTVRCDAVCVETVDTTGAGDTFCGYFLASLMHGAEVAESLACASAASALSVMREGAAQSIPAVEEVMEFLENEEAPMTRQLGEGEGTDSEGGTGRLTKKRTAR